MEKVKDLTLFKVAKEVGYQTIVFLAFYRFSAQGKDVIIWLLWCYAALGLLAIIQATQKTTQIKERWTKRFTTFELYSGALLSMQLVYWGHIVLATVLLILHILVCKVMSQRPIQIRE